MASTALANDMATTSNQFVQQLLQVVRAFYQDHTEIKASHGLDHIMRVYNHTCQAIAVHQPPLSPGEAAEVQAAALLHDVDDKKYFPHNKDYKNARSLLKQCEAHLTTSSIDTILCMIAWVSCSTNGNRVPTAVQESGRYHLLIPRWADRLEAVGSVGVIRCYQYSIEHNRPLSSPDSPRATTEAQVWQLATPDRFENYLRQHETPVADDMISHYYDKLLHVARPPPDVVRNAYLEAQGRAAAHELVQVCLDFGRTGVVNRTAIEQLATSLGMAIKAS